ncbi:UNVERIFIED_ORG: putative Mn2+ efflux pump MntP [Xanthobacter viscosus]|jgi:putative Mn2+ efflux pump MntP|uniref:Putative manganese efflux pump MntP n=1 Tax=Xanthobacter autotrophicus TaxID=280 RepID=A0A6C1KI73_XANAU|nr:manganese efflux pump MntP family protein [Xanthobacter autotrophicus]TLX43992.1 manganese efflux pump [Xanthobacter autotrophicus]
MSPATILVLAMSMSVDAFAVSVGRGAAMGRPRLSEALRTGAVFGAVETTTPLIGWAAGMAASSYMEAIDHWIAFCLLAGVGLHMLIAAFSRRDEEADDTPRGRSIWVLLATALGTSIDAMAVGVSLAFLNVNIVVVALAIGAMTFLMSSGGMLVGRMVGQSFGRVAEVAAGVALCGLGLAILIEHLSA